MSIIVKGMEMPYCVECKFLEFGDEVKDDFCLVDLHCVKDELIRNKNCPLVELPEKHGRLIDADKLIEIISEKYINANSAGASNAYKDIKYMIQDAPTIIEAEGRNDKTKSNRNYN